MVGGAKRDRFKMSAKEKDEVRAFCMFQTQKWSLYTEVLIQNGLRYMLNGLNETLLDFIQVAKWLIYQFLQKNEKPKILTNIVFLAPSSVVNRATNA
jgi:hypothetical protein